VKIYTKTGDDGETGLFGGERVPKAGLRIGAIGDVDELNAAIGWARCACGGSGLDGMLERIQGWLFEAGAGLACRDAAGAKAIPHLGEEEIASLESSIDEQTAALPGLRTFILPGGSEFAARLHLARAVCRRAERALCALEREEALNAEIGVFLNRLSDWLFVAARTANVDAGVTDVAWLGRETKR